MCCYVSVIPHQVMRVYYDRLVDDADRVWLASFLKEVMQKDFDTNFDTLFKLLDFNKDGVCVWLASYLPLSLLHSLTPSVSLSLTH